MNQIDFKSILKAAAVGGIVNTLIAIVSGASNLIESDLPNLIWFTLCCGAILVPVGSGLFYGRFAARRESMGNAALGGGLAGVASGVIFGLANLLVTLSVGLFESKTLDEIVTASTTVVLSACCGAFVFGALLGALGGVGWSLIQGES